jgi:hypothetical protein
MLKQKKQMCKTIVRKILAKKNLWTFLRTFTLLEGLKCEFKSENNKRRNWGYAP